ncbi:MAG: ABC transporter permease [Clostridiaceae bacterium]
MQVYKAFIKIIYKNLSQIVIYIGIFLFFAIILTRVYTNPVNTDFTETKTNIAFINYDENSKLVDGLKDYLDKNANIIDIEDNAQQLQDALFFREVEYIIKVPKGFTQDFMNGKDVKFEKTSLPNSTSNIYMDNIINKYLNTAKVYTDSIENISEAQLIDYIDNDLSKETEVKINSTGNEGPENDKINYYFNYLAYSVFAILILGVCSVMIVFNNTDLKKRNNCSPVKLKSINIQMILGNVSFAAVTWFILIFASFIMYRKYMVTVNGVLLLLNSFIFTLAALSVAYLIGNLLKSRGAISAAANVVSLGSSFISGVFVSQEFLGESVLTLASFTPTYWYVKTNNFIASTSNFKKGDLTFIFTNMVIVLGFALATLAVTLVVIKQKRVSN